MEQNILFHKYTVEVFLSENAKLFSWQKCSLYAVFEDFHVLPITRKQGTVGRPYDITRFANIPSVYSCSPVPCKGLWNITCIAIP